MTVTAHRGYQSPKIIIPVSARRRSKGLKSKEAPPLLLKRRDLEQAEVNEAATFLLPALAASFKAGLAGGVSAIVLLLLGLVPVEFLVLLVLPGFLVTFLSSGALACIYADKQIESIQQAGEVGWGGGFWAGIHAGNMSMVMAAAGIFLKDFGQAVTLQLTPSYLESWGVYGLDSTFIALVARVGAALVVYGLIGALVGALLGTVGAMFCYSLREEKIC